MNFYKRSYQPILRYLYTEAIKRRSEILLHGRLNKYKQIFIVSKEGGNKSFQLPFLVAIYSGYLYIFITYRYNYTVYYSGY